MRIFVAGATGALGKQLLPRLSERGHEVTGMTRTESKQELIRELGGPPVVADALDPDAVAQAVARGEPEASSFLRPDQSRLVEAGPAANNSRPQETENCRSEQCDGNRLQRRTGSHRGASPLFGRLCAERYSPRSTERRGQFGEDRFPGSRTKENRSAERSTQGSGETQGKLS